MHVGDTLEKHTKSEKDDGQIYCNPLGRLELNGIEYSRIHCQSDISMNLIECLISSKAWILSNRID